MITVYLLPQQHCSRAYIAYVLSLTLALYRSVHALCAAQLRLNNAMGICRSSQSPQLRASV